MDLSPTIAELETSTSDCSTFVVAFSGGADSLLALDLAAEIAARRSQNIIAWYCHHYATPVEDKRQGIFDATARRLNKVLGTHFQLVKQQPDIDRISARLGYSWEHTASLVRRKYLLHLADRLSGTGRAAVITGHNYSDYLETLALRRERKIPETALPALAFAAPDTGFLRPLYRLSREQVREAIAARGLAAYDDPANDDIRFARNRVRVAQLAAPHDEHMPAPKEDAEQLQRVHRRELQLPAGRWAVLEDEERARTLFHAFRRLAIVKKFTRNHFARAHALPFRLPPFFAHRENTGAGDSIIFRRGLGAHVNLPPAEEGPYLRGDCVSRRVKIATPFGHKSVIKFFSERRLSPRERRRTLVYLAAPESDNALRISFPGGSQA